MRRMRTRSHPGPQSRVQFTWDLHNVGERAFVFYRPRRPTDSMLFSLEDTVQCLPHQHQFQHLAATGSRPFLNYYKAVPPRFAGFDYMFSNSVPIDLGIMSIRRRPPSPSRFRPCHRATTADPDCDAFVSYSRAGRLAHIHAHRSTRSSSSTISISPACFLQQHQ